MEVVCEEHKLFSEDAEKLEENQLPLLCVKHVMVQCRGIFPYSGQHFMALALFENLKIHVKAGLKAKDFIPYITQQQFFRYWIIETGGKPANVDEMIGHNLDEFKNMLVAQTWDNIDIDGDWFLSNEEIANFLKTAIDGLVQKMGPRKWLEKMDDAVDTYNESNISVCRQLLRKCCFCFRPKRKPRVVDQLFSEVRAPDSINFEEEAVAFIQWIESEILVCELLDGITVAPKLLAAKVNAIRGLTQENSLSRSRFRKWLQYKTVPEIRLTFEDMDEIQNHYMFLPLTDGNKDLLLGGVYVGEQLIAEYNYDSESEDGSENSQMDDVLGLF